MSPPSALYDAPVDRDALVARSARVALALTLVVIVASALLRHVQAGLACTDWPRCYAAVDAEAAHATLAYFARLAHRLAASAVLLIGLALAWLAARRRALARYRPLALSAFAITLGLAALGLVMPLAQRPVVALANLVGGFALAACFAALAAQADAGADARLRVDGPSMAATPGRGGAVVLLAFAFAVAVSGGAIGAQFALTSCLSLPGCDSATWPSRLAGSAFDPLRLRAIAHGAYATPAGAAMLQLVHRALGALLVAVVVAAAARLRAGAPRTAAALLALAVATPAAGVAAVALAPSLGATLVHNACAALIVVALSALAARPSSRDRLLQ